MTAASNLTETTNDVPYRRAVLFLLLFGFVLRLIGLGQPSYWFDEAREVLRALTPWPDVLFVSGGVDPPVYRLLLFPIASITLTEFWLRLPSVLFSVATIYLAYYWLRLLGQLRLGLITAVLLTVAPVQIYYAQEVSQYSLVVFLAMLVLIAFEQAAQNGRWRDWLFLTLISLSAVYTYYGLAWLFPILELDLVWRTWKQRNQKRTIGYLSYHLTLVIGLVALYFLLLSAHIERFTTNKSLAPRFIEPGLSVIIRTLDNELLNGFVRFFSIPYSPSVPQPIIAFFAVLIMIGMVLLWRREQTGIRVVIYMVGTVAAMYLGNGLGLYPFGDRYALAALPFAFVMLAVVIESAWRWQRAAGVLVAGIVIFIFITFWPNLRLIPNPWLALPREDLRPVVSYVQDHAQPGDVIYVYYGANPAYQVYQREVIYPTTHGPWFREWPSAEKLDHIQQSVAGAQQFWLVLSHITGNEYGELVDGMADSMPSYQVVDEYVKENAAAVLLQRAE